MYFGVLGSILGRAVITELDEDIETIQNLSYEEQKRHRNQNDETSKRRKANAFAFPVDNFNNFLGAKHLAVELVKCHVLSLLSFETKL